MKDRKEVLTTYVSDMLSLERHLLSTVESQAKDNDLKQQPEAGQLLNRLDTTLHQHTDALKRRLDSLGGSATAGLKEAVTALTGMAGGAIGKIRPQTVSKFLRDDYAALGLCTVSYEMLHTTALALQDQETAGMALRHLQQLTPLTMEIADVMPGVVVSELSDDVKNLDPGVVAQARLNNREAWRIPAEAHHAE